MLQHKIGLLFVLVLMVGVAVSFRIVSLGGSVQKINRQFVAEKLPLSQRIGELRGAIADEERLLYEYYSYTATREAYQIQRAQVHVRLGKIVDQLELDMGSRQPVEELRIRLFEFDQLSDELSATLASREVNWDFARAILNQVKPKVRQIEKTLAVMSSSNRSAVDNLAEDSQLSVSTMEHWVISFSVLIIVVASFVAYYVVFIFRAAFIDPYTGLPNQNSLRNDLKAAFTKRSSGTVIMIAADREREIFESIGAVLTQRWLVTIAQRLGAEIVAEKEKLYRSGEDAFVLINFSGNLEDAQQRARQLLGAVQQPIIVDGHQLISTLSIGAASIDFDAGDNSANMAEVQVQRAASACNRVRKAGGNDFATYDATMGNFASKILHLAADLQHAVDNNELRLLYQPKVETSTGRLLGMEALVRWQHPSRGMISPVEFIPVAEDTGLIVAIGRWVLREACRQNMAWQREGLRPLRVAVNLSARQLRSGELLEEIDSALADSGMPLDSLELEITESMVMENPDSVIQLLNAIHGRGIHIALDDFGTGHSSLAYLKRFPINCLKVDRAFIKDTPENADDVAITKTIIAMAKSLGLATVAEGVETAEQLAMLKSIGCDQIQGYFFSRPLPADEFLSYYRAHSD